VLFAIGQSAIGVTLVFTGAGSMVAASLVLLLSSPDKSAAALKQGVIPALGVIALAVGLAL
jgi:putative membrane protein